jgi:RNA-directed DNA polymerase
VTNKQPQQPPAAVPIAAKQAGDVRARWAWTEAAVWTDRMLTALEQGVKGTDSEAKSPSGQEASQRGQRVRQPRPQKWFSLIDKVASELNLFTSFRQVASNNGAAGVDHVTVDQFARHQSKHSGRLHKTILDGSYTPHEVRRVWIPKPGSKEKRPLGIPTVRDRVVQTALRNVIEPIFEKDFAEHSYGFRPNRGCKDALRVVDTLIKSGYTHVVDADLKGYFDTIPHEKLMDLVREKISDSRVLTLIEKFLKQRVMDGLETWTPESGSPQGAVVSPLLSNIYLDPLDHRMADCGFKMVRYADDFVILCRSREEAEAALALVQTWVNEAELTLHPEKTMIVDARTEGFDFLGYHFHGERRWPRKKSLAKLKDAIRAKTRRANGHSLECIIADVNRTLRGWFEYFKHSRRWTFHSLDAWIRMRLRSILRKRRKGKGRGRGRDHVRWPNRYFAARGLFSMVTAHASASQSLIR